MENNVYMAAYDNKINSKFFNVTIDGFPLIGYDHSPSESYNRRETSRKNIIGGTQDVMRTSYVPVDITFKAKFRIDPLYPDVYDSTFRLWMSKSVEVESREFGGKFKAECIVKRTHETPSYLTLEIQLIEIPDTSRIPGDDYIVATDQITKTVITSKGKTSRKNSRKNSKKTSKKSKNKKNKKNKKGGKITKTK